MTKQEAYDYEKTGSVHACICIHVCCMKHVTNNSMTRQKVYLLYESCDYHMVMRSSASQVWRCGSEPDGGKQSSHL